MPPKPSTQTPEVISGGSLLMIQKQQVIFSCLAIIMVISSLSCFGSDKNVDKPLALQMQFEEIWKSAETIKVTSEKSIECSLPALPSQPGKIAVIRYQARVNGFTGWNIFLGLHLNGQPLEETDRNGIGRLINRASIFSSSIWETQIMASDNHYLIFFTQDFNKIDPSITDIAQQIEATWFMLRIDDLSKKDSRNLLRLSNSYPKAEVEVASLAVGYIPAKEAKEQKPLALRLPFERIWRHEKPIRIGAEQSAKISIPPIPQAVGQTIAIRFQTRLVYPEFEGWNTFLKLNFNDEAVTELDKCANDRLLNRSTIFSSTRWGTSAMVAGNNYITFFTPDINAINKEWVNDPAQLKEATWYVLRIEDLAKTDGTNILKFTSAVNPNTFKKDASGNVPVVEVASLEIGYIKAKSSIETDEKITVDFSPTGTLKTSNYSVSVSSNGGFCVAAESGKSYFDASFSYPFAGKNWNAVSADKKNIAGEAAWKPVTHLDRRNVTVEAKGKYYTFKRQVICHERFLEIHDVFMNKTDYILGIIVRNRFVSEENPLKLKIGGYNANPELPTEPVHSPSNPTLFFGMNRGGLGIFAQDTAFRNQLMMETKRNVAVFGSNELGLAPKETYTLRWRIYPMEDNDYFSFINRLRSDIGANYTILGPGKFFGDIRDKHRTITPEEFNKSMERQYAPVGMFSPWFCYYDGGDLSLEAWIGGIRRGVANFKKGLPPEVRLLPCFETSIQPVPDEIEIKLWPEDLEEWPTSDGFIVTKDNKFSSSKQYTLGKPVTNFRSYIKLDTKYYKKFMAGIDGAMDAGFRGIYFDLFVCPNLRTYDQWDGRTVEMDADSFTVARETALLPILEGPAKKAIVEHIIQRGGIVVCNDYPVWEELQSTPLFSFSEASDINGGHLGAPIGLSAGWDAAEGHSGADLVAAVIARLKKGGLFYYYATIIKETDNEAYELVKNMYPITIEELHAGWIKGKERTITCVPGKYTVGGSKPPKVILFTKEGKKSSSPPEALRPEGKTEWLIDLTQLPAGSAVIIENIL
ncbi:MAG: hypothetical protein HY360_21300 [Verrucomicrobia bacterium]|nr:hypothetical protein [Verrucomicrobiota bacterium]